MDTSQFTALIRRNAALIQKVALAYCSNRSDRDDVVQEIAAALWRSREHFDARLRETTWIYRIALNVAISFYRRERKHHEGRASLDEHEQVFACEPVELHEEVQRLLAAIAELGALERALVIMHLDGNDHTTIAEVLGISVSNVGTKLGRIRAQLRVTLARAGRTKERGDSHATR